MRASLHGLDADRHVEIRPILRPGSRELVELFQRQAASGDILANDTSCGVGFAPFSTLERVVLEVQELTAPQIADSDPAIGEDVKVMGVRRGERVELTVACALIGRHLGSLDEYGEAKERVAEIARNAAARVTDGAVDVAVNVGDDPAGASVYLTATGTSAEAGDDGQAGRGNRVTGLITPYRPMVMESAPGKNPVSHTGKVYTLAAHLLAHDLIDELPEVVSARCLLLSRIGAPVKRPHLIDVSVRTREETDLERLRPQIRRIVDERLEGLGTLWRDVLAGVVSAVTPGRPLPSSPDRPAPR